MIEHTLWLLLLLVDFHRYRYFGPSESWFLTLVWTQQANCSTQNRPSVCLQLNPGATEADQHLNTSSGLVTWYRALSGLLWIIGCIIKVRMFVQQGLVPRPLIIQPSKEMCTLTSAKSPGIGHSVRRALGLVEERSELQKWERNPTGSSPLPEECSFPYCVGAQEICCVSVLLKCTQIMSCSHKKSLNVENPSVHDRFP